MCLHARLVDLSSGVGALLKAHDVAGIYHLVRGQLEAFGDLLNLLSDPAYVEQMDAAYCAEVRRVLQAVVREGLGEKHLGDMSASLKTAEDRLDELKKRGVSRLNVSDRFRRAGLAGEYYSVYAYLCTHTHNNVSALETRHVDKTREPHQLLIGSDEIDTELAIVIELSLRMPMDALKLLIQRFEGLDATEYARLRTDFDALRAKWAPLVGLSAKP